MRIVVVVGVYIKRMKQLKGINQSLQKEQDLDLKIQNVINKMNVKIYKNKL